MPVATTYLKLVLILFGVLFFYYSMSVDWLVDRGLWIGAGIALLVTGMARISKTWRARLPNAFYFWCAPLFVLALWGRLQLEPAVPDPPEIWYSLSAEKPVYDASLLGTGVVRRWIGPRTYMVDVSLRATQKKVKRYRRRTETKRRRPAQKNRRDTRTRRYTKDKTYNKTYQTYKKQNRFRTRRKYRQRKGYQRKAAERPDKNVSRENVSRTNVARPKRTNYKQRSRRRSYKKSYRTRWGKERVVAPEDARSFPVLVRVNEEGWYPGCHFQFRVFGRGVPRRWRSDERDSGFAAYVRRKGAGTYLRLSRKYNVLSAACDEPGPRYRARQRLDRILKQAGLQGDPLGVARGLLLGRSGFLYGDMKRAARELGILHVFAASGLHLGIFFACLALPLGRLRGKRHWLTLCAPLPFCLAYLWLLDFPVSLTRAFVFVSLYALQALVPVHMSVIDRLANTALAALLIAPREMCSLSGALSFGAVGGILIFFQLLYKQILRPRRVWWSWLCTQAAVSMTASLATTPILLYVFGAYAYGSPLANLIMVPLVGLLLPLLYSLVAADLAVAWLGGPVALLWPLRWLTLQGLGGFAWITEQLGPIALYQRYDSILGPPTVYTALLLLGLSGTLLIKAGRRGAPGLLRFLRWLVILALVLLGPAGYLLERAGFFLLAK